MPSTQKRYPGTRWAISYGSTEGPEGVALIELQRAAQDFVPYVMEVRPASAALPDHEENLFLVGTPASHRLIAELVEKQQLSVPEEAEGYTLACSASPWPNVKRVAVVAGHDAKGVLNGVYDFNSRVLASFGADNLPRLQPELEALPDLSVSEHPHIENRGIWTWGYVIYDYRRFLDNMARLKMNMLVFWNDCPPLNARQIVDYAHARGINVVFGFHWGWGIPDLSLSNPEHCRQVGDHVLANYRENYQHLGADGIYFQTLTEHEQTEAAGKSTAALACDWVNTIGRRLLEKYPQLYIQFGLHAISIANNYVDLKPLDKRISIIWEDAGVLPWDYYPRLSFPAGSKRKHAEIFGDFERALAYSKKLASFREGTEFGGCVKGFWCIDWKQEFEHHGPFVLGERSRNFMRNRLAGERRRWDHVNQLWLKYFPYAARFYREIRACATKMTIVALVEDGLFEETIPSSVALYAETLWNPARADEEILERATSGYLRQMNA